MPLPKVPLFFQDNYLYYTKWGRAFTLDILQTTLDFVLKFSEEIATWGIYMLIFPQHFLQACHGNGAMASLWAQFPVGCEMFLPVWKGFGQFDRSGDSFLTIQGLQAVDSIILALSSTH